MPPRKLMGTKRKHFAGKRRKKEVIIYSKMLKRKKRMPHRLRENLWWMFNTLTPPEEEDEDFSFVLSLFVPFPFFNISTQSLLYPLSLFYLSKLSFPENMYISLNFHVIYFLLMFFIFPVA